MFFRKKSETEWQPEPISKITRRDRKGLKNWRVKRKAIRDARNNLPEDAPKNDPKYSNTERDIFSFAKRRYEELCQIYENSLQNLVKSIDGQYRIDILASDYESDFIKDVESEIDNKFAEKAVKLHLLAKEELRSNKDLRAFKARNELDDSAKSAKPISWILVIILAYLLGESIFNMFIFQDISDAGLTGGFVLAAGCSAANIIMGFFCGFGGRLMVHISLLKKITGICISLPMIGLASLWNLFIAHFREVIIAHYSKPEANSGIDISNLQFGVADSETAAFSLSDAGKKALENLMEIPLAGVSDITSYLLLMIGLTVFILVSWKTYNQFWDPYIGYSRAQGKADKATQEWQKGQNNAIESIKYIIRKHKDDWQGQISDSENKIDRVQEAGNTLVAHRTEIVGNIEAMKRDANRILQVYREKNTYVRDVKPAHFDNWVEFLEMKANTQKETSTKKLADIDFLPTKISLDKLDKLKSVLAKNQKVFASMTRQVNEIQTHYLKGIQKRFDAIYATETKNVLKGKKQEGNTTKATEPIEEETAPEDSGIV